MCGVRGCVSASPSFCFYLSLSPSLKVLAGLSPLLSSSRRSVFKIAGCDRDKDPVVDTVSECTGMETCACTYITEQLIN